ncbi:MAG: SwmB domain-containing protein, partial [Rhodocyclaceae bacterium]|nr:SwmB domain-containing protein [Rhodocyclaceae bacterium]
MGNFDLHGLINTIASNHGVTVPARNAQRKMRDAREGRNRDSEDEATARGEDDATSAPTDASMQLAQADTGAVTETAAGETAAGASGTAAAGEAAAGSGAAAGGPGLGGLGLGGLALGGVAAAAGGGGSAVAAVVNNIITGTVVAGPVLGGNGLKVEIYAANGTTKLGESTLDATGKFTVNVGTYTGIVIARLVDANGGDDYLDEATGVPKDLNANLMATSVVTGGTVTLNINPLTTIAAQKAGLAADGSGSLADATAVANANAAVAAAFGLTDLTGTSVVATNGGSYDSTDGMSDGEKYGAILAALSGADFANSGDSQDIIDDLVAALDVTGASGTLSAAGQSALIAGAAVVDSDFIAEVINIIRGGVTAPSAPTINAVATDNIINAAEVDSVITGTNETGATVALSIGGNIRDATVDGTTWSYTLTDDDLAAMGQGAEILSATQTDVLNNASSAGTRALSVDTIAPVFSSATVSGRTLVLTYNEALDAASMPLPNAFKVGGVAQGAPVAGVVDSVAKTITLTLATPVAYGQTGVTVSYTDPTGGNDLAAIQDVAGNDAATLTNQAVTNTTPEAPLYKSATVDGNTLVMTYDGDLDEGNLPPLDAFTVKVNGTAQDTLTSVEVDASDNTVTLTLAAAVTNGQTVTVSYTDPSTENDSNAIQDSSYNDAVTVSNRVVVNQTPDVTAPVFASAAVTGNGKSLILTYDEALDAANLPPLDAFTVKVNSAAQATPTSVVVNAIAGTVTLALAQPVTYGQTVTVSYTDPNGGNDLAAIQDAVGNDAVTLADQAVTNSASDTPFLEGATVQGNTLVLSYNEALDAGNIPLPGAFTVKVGSAAPVAPTNVVVDSSAKTVTLTLAATVMSGQTVTVSYIDPTTGDDTNAIQDAAGNDAFTEENLSVTNDTPPVFFSATVSGNTLVLTYSDALEADSGNIPLANAFTVKVNGTAQAVPTAVAVDAAARTVTLTLAAAVTNGQAVTVSYADPTTGNDAAAIQNAVGSDALGLTNQPVTNHTPPLLSGATVSGATLVLTYSDALEADSGNIPLASAFTVKVNGAAQAVPTAVAVDAVARTVTLTLAAAVTNGQAVTVSYADPTTGNDPAAIQDAVGNDASSVVNRVVTNTTPDATAPVLSGATVSGSTLVLTYNEALDAANEPGAGAFTVKVGGTAQAAPTDIVVNSAAKTVTLTLAAAVTHGQAVTVSYADPTTENDATAIQDTAGNDGITLTNQSVTNTTVNTAAPTLSVVTSAG